MISLEQVAAWFGILGGVRWVWPMIVRRYRAIRPVIAKCYRRLFPSGRPPSRPVTFSVCATGQSRTTNRYETNCSRNSTTNTRGGLDCRYPLARRDESTVE